MRLLKLLAFYITFNIFTCIQTMEKPKNIKTWLKTSDKKTIAITNEEKSHLSRVILTDRSEFAEIYTGFCKSCPTKVNSTKKDIHFFQKVIHKPTHYDNNETFPPKKYFKALVIAEKLCAPLLYAELLSARLPKDVIALITQKYMCLQNMHSAISERIRHKKIIELTTTRQYFFHAMYRQKERDEIVKNYLMWSNFVESQLDNLTENITLPQAVLLTMIKDPKQSYRYAMKLIPHMPGYTAFFLWNGELQQFVIDNLPIRLEFMTTKTGLNAVSSLSFNV